jgi:hypothetical protein
LDSEEIKKKFHFMVAHNLFFPLLFISLPLTLPWMCAWQKKCTQKFVNSKKRQQELPQRFLANRNGSHDCNG